jgi:hypothetical protein
MNIDPKSYAAAAAKAAQQAGATEAQSGAASKSSGLGNPIKKLARIPGARWVVSSIILAAAVGLAVDYLNTPIKAWLQYNLKAPFINQGKSVAQVAAEEGAAPQAKIQAEITNPAMAAENEQRVIEGNHEMAARILASADPTAFARKSDGHVSYHAVSIDLIHALLGGTALPDTVSDLDDLEGGRYDFLGGALKSLPVGIVVPLVFKDGKTLVTIADDANAQKQPQWVFVKISDQQYGAILESDFNTLAAAARSSE